MSICLPRRMPSVRPNIRANAVELADQSKVVSSDVSKRHGPNLSKRKIMHKNEHKAAMAREAILLAQSASAETVITERQRLGFVDWIRKNRSDWLVEETQVGMPALWDS